MGIWDWLREGFKDIVEPQPKLTLWPPEENELYKLQQENNRLKLRKRILELIQENDNLRKECEARESGRRKRKEDNGV